MVASPNVDTGGASVLADQFRALKQQADENGRKSMYPFSAGPDGQFQIFPDGSIVDVNGNPVVDTQLTYQDGTPAVSIAPGLARYGSKQQLKINDLAGNPMLLTDESAGYGLSAPLYTIAMQRVTNGGGFFSTAIGLEAIACQAQTFFYNPCINVGGLIYPLSAAFATSFSASSYTYRVQVTDGHTTIFSNPVTVTGAQFVNKMVLLPSSFMGAQSVEVDLLVKPTSAAIVFMTDCTAYGGSKALYDSNPGLH
jgi:hypothetical protein